MDEKSYEKAFDILLKSGTEEAARRIADETAEPSEEIEFSKEHLKKMKAIFAAEKRKQRRKKLARFTKVAACVAAAAIIVSGTAIFSVDAFRIKFMNFIYEKDKPNSDIYFGDNVVETYEDDYIYLGYIPAGFHLERCTSKQGDCLMNFANEDNYFSVSVSNKDGLLNIDTENAEVESTSVNGLDAFFSTNNRVNILVWSDNSLKFSIDGTVSKDEIMKIAENLKIK